jgi:hypothetical protein
MFLLLLALSGRATRADECPLLRAKWTLANRCLPISNEYTAYIVTRLRVVRTISLRSLYAEKEVSLYGT